MSTSIQIVLIQVEKKVICDKQINTKSISYVIIDFGSRDNSYRQCSAPSMFSKNADNSSLLPPAVEGELTLYNVKNKKWYC